jgi:protein phosphatase 1 regulatory subunit 37
LTIQIHSLRTAFTLNTALKQLFLTATGLTSLGAIALAEFLPESASLLALGLTENAIDLAGVMALSGGLKSNHVMRCLDLSIPVGDEEMARGCREIFNTCVRNTEEADKASKDAAAAIEGETEEEREKGAVWGMIDKSQLAKAIRLDDAKKVSYDDGPSSAVAHSHAECY